MFNQQNEIKVDGEILEPLDKIGYPGYFVSKAGNLYVLLFKKCGLTIWTCLEAIEKYRKGNSSVKKISEEYDIGYYTAFRLLRPDVRLIRKKKNSIQKNGRIGCSLIDKDGREVRTEVHRIVLEAFVGRCPNGMEACHNNGIPTDNRLENLRWDTHSSNMQDTILHGTHNRGENSGMAKLTTDEVVSIRK